VCSENIVEGNTFKVPIVREHVEPLRDGITAAGAYRPPQHPVEARLATFNQNNMDFKRVALNNIFGTHMPLRMQMEQSILSEFQRLPSLTSELVGLETMLGIDEDLGFEDFLHDPTCPESVVDVHRVMEERLGL